MGYVKESLGETNKVGFLPLPFRVYPLSLKKQIAGVSTLVSSNVSLLFILKMTLTHKFDKKTSYLAFN